MNEKVNDSTDKSKPSLNTLQQEARYNTDYKKRRNAVLINIAEAVALTAIVAAWCFVPGGAFVAAGALAAMAAVFIVKTVAHKYNESTMKKQLKDKFVVLEDAEEKRDKSQPSAELTEQKEDTPASSVILKQRLRPVEDGVLSENSSASVSMSSSPATSGFFSASASPSLPPLSKANLDIAKKEDLQIPSEGIDGHRP